MGLFLSSCFHQVVLLQVVLTLWSMLNLPYLILRTPSGVDSAPRAGRWPLLLDLSTKLLLSASPRHMVLDWSRFQLSKDRNHLM